MNGDIEFEDPAEDDALSEYAFIDGLSTEDYVAGQSG